MIFPVRTCGEVESVGVPYTVGTEGQSPQSRVGDDITRRILKLAKKISRGGVEGIDGAVAKVANQDVVTEAAENSRLPGRCPRVRLATRSRQTAGRNYLPGQTHRQCRFPRQPLGYSRWRLALRRLQILVCLSAEC